MHSAKHTLFAVEVSSLQPLSSHLLWHNTLAAHTVTQATRHTVYALCLPVKCAINASHTGATNWISVVIVVDGWCRKYAVYRTKMWIVIAMGTFIHKQKHSSKQWEHEEHGEHYTRWQTLSILHEHICAISSMYRMRMRFHYFRVVDRLYCCSGPSLANRFSGFVHRIWMHGFACTVHSKCSQKYSILCSTYYISICVLWCKWQWLCMRTCYPPFGSIYNCCCCSDKHTFLTEKKVTHIFPCNCNANGNRVFIWNISKYLQEWNRWLPLVSLMCAE